MLPAWLPTLPSLLPQNIQKRMLSYALSSILGTILQDPHILLDNLDLQLLQGNVTLRNVELDVKKANFLLSGLSKGIEVVKGRSKVVSVSVPVRDLLTGRISFYLEDVEIIIQPKSSVTSDIQPQHIPPVSSYDLAQSFVEHSTDLLPPTESILLDQLSQSISETPYPLSSSPSDVGLGPAVTDSISTAILSSFVDALKARINVSIDGLKITIEDGIDQNGKAACLSLGSVFFGPSDTSEATREIKIRNIKCHLHKSASRSTTNLSLEDLEDSLESSTSTIRSYSRSSMAQPSTDTLNQSMLFTSQEAESLYLSAMDSPPLHHPDQVEEQPFQCLWFEDDIELRLVQTDRTILKADLPMMHVLIDIERNLGPLVEIFAVIFETTRRDISRLPASESSSDGLEMDIRWSGTIVHIRSEERESVQLRLCDLILKSQKAPYTIDLEITQASLQYSADPNMMILKFGHTKPGLSDIKIAMTDYQFHVSLLPILLNITVAEILSLARPFKEITDALRSASCRIMREGEVYIEQEGWSRDLLVESPRESVSRGRHKELRVDLESLEATLTTSRERVNLKVMDIQVKKPIDDPERFTIDFSSLTIPSFLNIKGSSANVPAVTVSIRRSETEVLYEQFLQDEQIAHGIFEDLVFGDECRSADAMGTIKQECENVSPWTMDINLPELSINLERNDIQTLRNVATELGKIALAFNSDKGRGEILRDGIVGRWRWEVGMIKASLKSSDGKKEEIMDIDVQGVEGMIVFGVDGGDGEVVDIEAASFGIVVQGPEDRIDVINESVPKVKDSTADLGIRFVRSRKGPLMSRVGLYNLGYEYRVFNPWMENFATMFRSLPAMEPESSSSRDDNLPVIQLHIILTDCHAGLNPISLPSKGLLLLSSVVIRGEMSAGLSKFDVGMGKVCLLVIDDISNTRQAANARKRLGGMRGRVRGSAHILHLQEAGFVQVGMIREANATVRVLLGQNFALNMEIEDVGLQLDTCADSTQTLADLFNCLKPPVEYIEEAQRYRSGTNSEGSGNTSFLLGEIEEHAFGPNARHSDVLDQNIFEDEEVLVNDDVPFNLAFVESYYGSGRAGLQTEDVGDEDDILYEDEDIGHFAAPPIPPTAVEKGSFGDFEEQIRVLDKSNFGVDNVYNGENTGVHFIEEHFPAHSVIFDEFKEGKGNPLSIRLRNTRVVWNLHDGFDWSKTREAISTAFAAVELKAAEAASKRVDLKYPRSSTGKISVRAPASQARTATEVIYGPEGYDDEDIYAGVGDEPDDGDSEIGSILFNSIYVGIRKGQDPNELATAINREIDADGQSDLSGVSSVPSSSSPIGRTSSHFQLPNSTISKSGKALRLKRSRAHKVQINLRALSMDLEVYPALSTTILNTARVRIKDFEIVDEVPTSHWKTFAGYWRMDEDHYVGKTRGRESGSFMADFEIINVKPVHALQASEMIVKYITRQARMLPLRLFVDQDTLDFLTRFFEFKDESAMPANAVIPEPPFIQRMEVLPINLKLDYKPKRVDYGGLRSGRTTEFMNFFILEDAEMLLKHVVLHGLSGWPKVFQTLNDIWMPDIRNNQLADVLSGIAPSLINVVGGVKNLVLVPVQEYRKDGRLVRSVGRGFTEFAKTTGTELINLGTKLAIGTQVFLEGAEEFIQGREAEIVAAPGVRFADEDGSDTEIEAKVVNLSPYADQPANVKQGIKRAIDSLSRNLNSAKETILAVPTEIVESGNAKGAAKAVVKAVPVAIIRPVIGASGAVSNTLMGIRNAMDSKQQQRIEDKYKRQ